MFLAELAGGLQRMLPPEGPRGLGLPAFMVIGDSWSGFGVEPSSFTEARLKDWKGMTTGRSLEIKLGDVMIRVFAPEPEMSVAVFGHPEIHA